MKENKSKKGLASRVGAIVILVIAAFAFIYVPGMTQSVAGSIVYGKYDGKKITDQTTEFYSALQQILAQREQAGEQVSIEKYYSVLEEAFYSAVQSMAYASEVEKTKYVPTDAEITDRLLQYISSQTDNASEFVKTMSTNDKNVLYEAAKKDLIVNRYIEDFFGSQYYSGMYGLKSSEAESEFISNMNIPQRAFDMVAFSKSSYPESELVAYGNNNADLFTSYDLSAITSNNENSLKQTLDQIKKNEITFEDAVTNLSTKTNTDTTGKVLNKYKYQLQSNLTSDVDFETVTNLAVGDISPVIKTSNGYAIFRCNSASLPADFTNEEVLDTVSIYMTYYESGLIEDYFLTLAEDFTTDALSLGFEAAAEKYGVTSVPLTSFPINYGGSAILTDLPYELSAAGAQYDENFFDVAFGLTENEISSPMVVGNNIVVLKLREEVEGSPVDAFSYMYYTSQFDQSSLVNGILLDEKVENRVSDAYFEIVARSAQSL